MPLVFDLRATQFSSPILLENVVDSCLERVRAEKESISSHRVRVWMSEGVLIFANDLNIGAHQHLKARTEAVPCVILRCRRAVQKVRVGIHGVVMKRPDQPGIEPIICASEPAGELNGRSNSDGCRRSSSKQVIIVMAEHSKSEEFHLPV